MIHYIHKPNSNGNPIAIDRTELIETDDALYIKVYMDGELVHCIYPNTMPNMFSDFFEDYFSNIVSEHDLLYIRIKYGV